VVVVGSVLGPKALGLYTVAQRVPELVIGSVTWNLSTVAFPALAQRRTQDDGSLTSTTVSLVRYSALFGLTSGAGLAMIAPELITILFSTRWAAAGAVMQPLAVMYGLVCIVFPLGDTFKALGKQPVMVAVNVLALPVTVGAMILAAPFGVVGVAWARVLVTVALGVLWLVLISRALDLRAVALAAALRPGCAAAAGVVAGAAAVLELLPQSPVVTLAVAPAAGCACAVLLLRLLDRRQYDELRVAVSQAWRSRKSRPDRRSPSLGVNAGCEPPS
jgi:PST family polysaccharide transporter